MIVSCPDCSVRLRIDPRRLAGKRVTLRCSRCRKVFQVNVPGPRQADDSLRVLIAHSDQELCRAVVDILSREGLSGQACHDGHQALQALQATPPQVAVIDVALPGMLAFELIDQLRRSPELQGIRIILLSSVYNKTAYKRRPTSLYGADDYIEKHHIPDDLVPKIHRLVGHAGAVAATDPGSAAETGPQVLSPPDDREFVDAMNSKIQRAEEQETSVAVETEARAKARRLARIIVADILLYNQERVDEGIRSGRFFELLEGEIAEGKRLFNERMPGMGDSPDDFLLEAFEAFVRRRQGELGL